MDIYLERDVAIKIHDFGVRRLIGVDIPGWVNRSAHVASAFGLTTKGINSSITSVNGRASAPKALPSPAQPDPPEIEEPEAARP